MINASMLMEMLAMYVNASKLAMNDKCFYAKGNASYVKCFYANGSAS